MSQGDVQQLLQTFLARLDTRFEEVFSRIDALDANAAQAREEARAAREEARASREQTEHLTRVVTVLGEGFKDLAGIVADAQVSTSNAIAALTQQVGALTQQVGDMNTRVDRLVERDVRARTHEVERYAALDARLTAVEEQVRALAAERPR